MKKLHTIGIAVVMICAGTASFILAGGPPGGNFWADGTVYSTVVTPANLPDQGPKDGLYVFDGLMGQNPVSESKPGDMDYNGGRWQVYVLEFTDEGKAAHDPDGDGYVNFQLMSWEMVQDHIGLGHLTLVAMGPTFVCPLIKQ
jgi:hypothetical protein